MKPLSEKRYSSIEDELEECWEEGMILQLENREILVIKQEDLKEALEELQEELEEIGEDSSSIYIGQVKAIINKYFGKELIEDA